MNVTLVFFLSFADDFFLVVLARPLIIICCRALLVYYINIFFFRQCICLLARLIGRIYLVLCIVL